MRHLVILTLVSVPYLIFAQATKMESKLEVYHMETDERRVVYRENTHFEAPNWSRDGEFLVVNEEGKLYKIPIDGSKKLLIPTDFAIRCNNDHGISPDGKTLVISNNDVIEVPDGEKKFGTSRIYVLPITGGTPQLITPKFPSYWHGWSPDGKTLAYVANREGQFDIYSIPMDGGEETRLTNNPGLDDGPDYSPDGSYIYYNSFKSGRMEIWRMHADGSKAQQLTDDPYSNWFPHPSPDGGYLVFLSYLEDQGEKHPPMKEVSLRLYDLGNGDIRTLCTFTGGQGTINVPSWSPDGKQFAFVSYRQLDHK